MMTATLNHPRGNYSQGLSTTSPEVRPHGPTPLADDSYSKYDHLMDATVSAGPAISSPSSETMRDAFTSLSTPTPPVDGTTSTAPQTWFPKVRPTPVGVAITVGVLAVIGGLGYWIGQRRRSAARLSDSHDSDDSTRFISDGTNEYTINATGDVVTGDEVRFERATFTGSYRKPRFAGNEIIEGIIVKESYGKDKQQHTFTIRRHNGETLLIKGRNLYRNGVWRKPWPDEDARKAVADEKHSRGDAARAERERRRESYR